MAGGAPNILVVNGERDERGLIATVLREAGFAVVAATKADDAWAAMSRERFAAAVIALPNGDAIPFLRQVRCRQPDLPALFVVEPAAPEPVEEDCAALVNRPLDPRRLLGCAVELVLREGERDNERATAPHRSDAAELGIAAAKLACLDNRRVAAAAAGAGRLARELTRQIGETRALYRGLAAAMLAGGLGATGAAD